MALTFVRRTIIRQVLKSRVCVFMHIQVQRQHASLLAVSKPNKPQSGHTASKSKCKTKMQHAKSTSFNSLLQSSHRISLCTCLMAVSPILSECFRMLSRKSLSCVMAVSRICVLSLGMFSDMMEQNRYWPALGRQVRSSCSSVRSAG